MSSARFNRLVRDAYVNNDIQMAYDAYKEYQNTHCLHPYMQEIFDAHTQKYRKIQVSCGRCYHCMQSKINEWCTRMYAHAEDFTNVYFVTLTYRSITNPNNQANKLLLSKLNQAVWSLDSANSTKHASYNPCVLVKEHYQKFLKRLRKNTGLTDITYVLSGEYGHQYGRPHFHMILFTNGVLTKADIIRAWSVCLWRKNSGEFVFRTSQRKDGITYDFPIGRVDFHDLVSNGTFNTTAKIKVEGQFMNAANCFAYVCKYVVKRDAVNWSRVARAYNGLYHKQTFTRIYDNEIPYSIAKDYLEKNGYPHDVAESLYNSHLKRISYEKTIFDPIKSIFVDGLLRTRAHKINGYEWSENLYPEVYYEFRNKFRPFCEFSRGTPIGSVYAKRNIQEFAQDIFTKPLLQDVGFVVPSYFRNKAHEHLYGLRKVRRTISGNSFVLTGLPDLLRRFTESSEHDSPLLESTLYSLYRGDIAAALRSDFCTYVDKSSGERIVMTPEKALYFKYNRHTKSYDNTKAVPLAAWLRYWCVKISDELARNEKQVMQSKQNLKNQESAFLIMTDLGQEPTNLRERWQKDFDAQHQEQQKLYHEQHKSVE